MSRRRVVPLRAPSPLVAEAPSNAVPRSASSSLALPTVRSPQSFRQLHASPLFLLAGALSLVRLKPSSQTPTSRMSFFVSILHSNTSLSILFWGSRDETSSCIPLRVCVCCPSRRHFARFGSITLNDCESAYSQAKLELYRSLFRDHPTPPTMRSCPSFGTPHASTSETQDYGDADLPATTS